MVLPSVEQNLDLTEDLKQRVIALGFARVGVAKAEPLHPETAQLSAWVRQSHHGSMDYMARTADVRCDPTHAGMLPQAQSIVVAAASYGGGSPNPDLGPGKIARYAHGRDYHAVLHRRLDKVARWLRQCGFATRCAIDRLPVLERAWAQRAGVGFIGKNCCLIVPGLGSHVLIATLITAAPLRADMPIQSGCGTCRRCLDACPTEAFVAPHQLDAKRCISYLTIEHRGAIDESLRGRIGDWFFGCDACQDACPYNHGKAQQSAAVDGLGPDARWSQLTAADFLSQPAEEVSQWLVGSALRRAGPESLARNAAMVLANTGDRRHLPVLHQAANSHASAVVREAASVAALQLESRAEPKVLHPPVECGTSPAGD